MSIGISNNNSNIYEELGLTQKKVTADESRSDMGQEDFLSLMTAQLMNQDPSAPMESGDFLGQMAQFGTVSGIQGLQDSFSGLADSLFSNQALQASSMVGRSALISSPVGFMSGDSGLKGAVEVSQSVANLTVSIVDTAGQTIKKMDLGGQAAGDIDFHWDGTNQNGASMPEGEYRIVAEGMINGQPQAMSTLVEGHIESVSLSGGGAGITFNLTGMGQAGFADLKQVRE